MFSLPLIESIGDLCSATHLSKSLLFNLSKFADTYYKRFEIPKKNRAGTREICSPRAELKAVQAWILRNILDKITVHPSATGFRLGRNILANVVPHRHNRWVICLDIEDFFPSIGYGKVWTIFRTLGYSKHIAHVFACLCTCNGTLPQGGVTSPALSNVVCSRLDRRLSAYCGRRDVVYTRYADDLTFSAGRPQVLVPVRQMAEMILRDEGFQLNDAKTRIMGPRQRRKVTGLVISDGGGIGIGRKQKRVLRAKIFGLFTNSDISEDERNRLKIEIDGWFAFLRDVDRTAFKQLKKFHDVMWDGLYGNSIHSHPPA